MQHGLTPLTSFEPLSCKQQREGEHRHAHGRRTTAQLHLAVEQLDCRRQLLAEQPLAWPSLMALEQVQHDERVAVARAQVGKVQSCGLCIRTCAAGA